MKPTSLFVALAAAAIVPAAIASGGTIVKLEGKAVIERRSLKVEAAESTPIYSGDTLNVADQGVAQMVLEDDSVFVVPGGSRLRIDSFAVAKPGAGGKAVYTLLNGGLRTITGKVSKGGDDQYELRTEEGTIGVAGSAYMAMRCQGACAGKHKAGLYVRGESGTITVANAAGKLKLRRGQTAHVANKDTLPVHVRASPFDDPLISADFALDAEFNTEVHPPRVEPELTPSPS
jgi:hypothetical protein